MLIFYIPPFKAVASVHIHKHLTAESYYVDVSFGVCIAFFFLTERRAGVYKWIHCLYASWSPYRSRPPSLVSYQWKYVWGKRSQSEGVCAFMCFISVHPHTSRTAEMLNIKQMLQDLISERR